MDPKAFLAATEQAWRERRAALNGKRLTRLHVHIAAKLAFWRHSTARHRALARAARCSPRTVRRALTLLRDLGLLSWTRRVVCCRGWVAQIANAYAFSPVSPSLNLPLNPIRIHCPANLAAPAPGAVGSPRLPDLLAVRRQTMAARLAAGGRASRL